MNNSNKDLTKHFLTNESPFHSHKVKNFPPNTLKYSIENHNALRKKLFEIYIELSFLKMRFGSPALFLCKCGNIASFCYISPCFLNIEKF